MRNRIRLETMSDVNRFVSIVSGVEGKVVLTDGDGFTVNAKSVLGTLYTMEWDEVWIESSSDIYSKVKEFVVE